MRKRNKKAFSFIEVMAAMTILSITLIVLMDSQGRSMNLVTRSQSMDYATTLAVAKMTEIEQLVIAKGITVLKEEEKGEFEQEKHAGYAWRYWRKQVPMPNLASMISTVTGKEEPQNNEAATNMALFEGPLQQITKVWGEAIHELHVEVTWNFGNRQRSCELVTHVIASNALSQVQGAIGALTGGNSQEKPGE